MTRGLRVAFLSRINGLYGVLRLVRYPPLLSGANETPSCAFHVVFFTTSENSRSPAKGACVPAMTDSARSGA